MNALRDVWVPEVEAEYAALLATSRDVAADVGNQFRAFEQVLRRGPDAAWRALDYFGAVALYAMYARHAMMFFAVSRGQAAIVKWTVVGTEHQQRLALAEAKQRAQVVFARAE